MPKRLKRALSIRQPYVEMILRGKKKIEYRSRYTNIRERVYLYAAKTEEPQYEFDRIDAHKGDFPTGVIVGSVEITRCSYLEGRDCYEWHLEEPKRLRKQLKPINQPQPGIWRPKFED